MEITKTMAEQCEWSLRPNFKYAFPLIGFRLRQSVPFENAASNFTEHQLIAAILRFQATCMIQSGELVRSLEHDSTSLLIDFAMAYEALSISVFRINAEKKNDPFSHPFLNLLTIYSILGFPCCQSHESIENRA